MQESMEVLKTDTDKVKKLKKKFARNLKAIREKRGITHNDLFCRLAGNDFTKFMKQTSIQRNEYTSRIRAWENPAKPTSVSLDYLMDLCDILDCDIDYLYGRSDVDSRSVQKISDYLGLSPATIRKIRHFDETTKQLLDDVIQHKNFDRLLYSIGMYVTSMIYKIVQRNTVDGQETEINNPVKKDLLSYTAREEFGKILDDLYFAREKDFLKLDYKNKIIDFILEYGELYCSGKMPEKLKKKCITILSQYQEGLRAYEKDSPLLGKPQTLLSHWEIFK